MQRQAKSIVTLLSGLVLSGGVAMGGMVALTTVWSMAPAAAQESGSQHKTRKVVAMRAEVLKKVQEVNALINPQDEEGKPIPGFKPDYRRALAVLDSIKAMKDNNSADLTTMWNFYAYVYLSQDNYPKALQAYEQIIALPDADPRFVSSILYNMAQLYMATEQYRKAIGIMDKWFKENEAPAPDAYILYGQAYYMLDDYKRALQPIERGVALARERNQPPKEAWYQLLRHVYYETGNKAKSLEMVEFLVKTWPKKIYFLQLAQMYGEMNQELKQLAVFEAAYKNGYLNQSKEIENLAQLYLYHGAPYKAAKIMQEGMEKGTVQKTKETWDLLARGYLNAQEYKKAVGPLNQAAQLSNDGEMYYRLAQVYLQMDDYENAIKAASSALQRGRLRRPDDVYVVRAMAEYNLHRLSDARKSFQEAAKSANSRQLAENWIKYIDGEQKRLEALRQFLAN